MIQIGLCKSGSIHNILFMEATFHIEEIYRAPLQYKQIASCKFLSAVNPNEAVDLRFLLAIRKNEANTLQVQVEGASTKEVCIKLKAQLISK